MSYMIAANSLTSVNNLTVIITHVKVEYFKYEWSKVKLQIPNLLFLFSKESLFSIF